ncbi:MAG: cyanophycinase [Thalassobius sp.]|nr:cyanophycinase [Thalassovita sp.]
MKKSAFLLFNLLFIFSVAFSQSEPEELVTTGPQKGSLVIVGGGKVGNEIWKRFIELAGGNDAAIVVIPTAGGGESYDETYSAIPALKEAGATNVTLLHTYDRATADSDAFVEPLKNAKAVWFGGGRQWRLVDAYKDTKTEGMFWKILDNGGVIGGSSAGATIQGSYLARGDTKNNQIMMGDHEEGFGFVKNIAIDQHVLVRNRQFDMFDILKNKPELLGIGIDESTAVVVQGNEFEVIGKSYVLIYDTTFWSREGFALKNLPERNQLFYFLKEGDKYNMEKRERVE